jgi:hypothetical protein
VKSAARWKRRCNQITAPKLFDRAPEAAGQGGRHLVKAGGSAADAVVGYKRVGEQAELGGRLLLRVDKTVVKLFVSNQSESADADPHHPCGRGVRARRLQRQPNAQPLQPSFLERHLL